MLILLTVIRTGQKASGGGNPATVLYGLCSILKVTASYYSGFCIVITADSCVAVLSVLINTLQ